MACNSKKSWPYIVITWEEAHSLYWNLYESEACGGFWLIASVLRSIISTRGRLPQGVRTRYPAQVADTMALWSAHLVQHHRLPRLFLLLGRTWHWSNVSMSENDGCAWRYVWIWICAGEESTVFQTRILTPLPYIYVWISWKKSRHVQTSCWAASGNSPLWIVDWGGLRNCKS